VLAHITPGAAAPEPHRRPASWRSLGRHALASLAHAPER
jgi:hypothetical protein